MRERVTGFDLARALAVFGMVIVNFKIAMNSETGSSILMTFATLFEGRAAAIFVVSDKSLLLISAIIMIMFPILMLLFDYEQNWNWSTLAYENFWSLDGMIRHIVFNGFHPIFPWAAFLTFGMWIGRQDLSKRLIRNRLLVGSLITLVITEFGSYFLFSISIIPPLPQYVISAASSAIIILIGCLYFSDRFSESNITKWLCQTGQLSLTLYIAHVIIGMGFLESIGKLENQTIDFSLLSAFIFCVCGICFSVVWLKYLKIGPLEWFFRKVAS